MKKDNLEKSGELFAFKLATKKEAEQPTKRDKWQTRDGVSAAGCTVVRGGHPLCPNWGDGLIPC
ncbi:MAG: hypothetical protein AAFX85_13795 [Pseudomonadota bacterium]